MRNSTWARVPFLGAYLASRRRQALADAVVARFCEEPRDADVQWLADAAAAGDVDHARWELRYARRALGLLAAQRDALDDRTGSDVANAMARAFASDPCVAPDRRELAERQFNERVGTYRDALQARGLRGGPMDTVGRMLLAYASDAARTAGSPLPRAIALMEAYAAEATQVLHDVYGGAPALPDDLKPSEIFAKTE